MTPTLATRHWLLICLTLIIGGCKQPYPAYNTRFMAFGTLIDLSLIDVAPGKAERVTAAIQEDFQYLHRAWHAWNPGPLGRVNQLLPTGEHFAIPPSVEPLIRRATALSVKSGGLFNPAIGRLVELWGFHTDEPKSSPPPSPEAITALVRANPQMTDIHIEGIMAWSDNPAVQLDFGAFGKGYGIDLAIEHLREQGIANAILNAGGDLRAIGDRDGNPWRIAIRRPTGAGVFATIDVRGDESVFTSGDYERNFVYKGKTYHHIIDPRTGYPARGTRSVTVVHSDAATADAAATALFVAGPEHWYSVAKAMGIRYVLLVDDRDSLHMNPAMADRIKLLDKDQNIRLSPPLLPGPKPSSPARGG